ncbi:MAG: hydrogenase maturation protease [Thermoanaerobaculia bacterium]
MPKTLEELLADIEKSGIVSQMVVLGCGKRAVGDDAAGRRVVESLRERDETIDCRTFGGELFELLELYRAGHPLFILDAMRTAAHPGTLLLTRGPTTHARLRNIGGEKTDWNLDGIAGLAKDLGYTIPPLWIMGIEGSSASGELTPEVSRAVDFVVENFDALRAVAFALEPGDPPVILRPPAWELPPIRVDWGPVHA